MLVFPDISLYVPVVKPSGDSFFCVYLFFTFSSTELTFAITEEFL